MSRRIAIVEDDRSLRENYADVLRRQGYEVATYPDRPQAMLAFRTRLPELAVVDIGLGDEIDTKAVSLRCLTVAGLDHTLRSGVVNARSRPGLDLNAGEPILQIVGFRRSHDRRPRARSRGRRTARAPRRADWRTL